MDFSQLAELIQSILSAESDEQRSEILADVDLDVTEQNLRDAANELLANGDDTPEVMETVGAIADAIDSIRAERAARQDVETAREQARADLAARLSGTTADSDVEDESEEDESEDDSEELAKHIPPQAGSPSNAGGDPPAASDPDEQGDNAHGSAKKGKGRQVSSTETEIVKAPAPTLDTLRRLVPAEAQPTAETELASQRVKIQSAVDVPGRIAGSDYLSSRDLADALIARQEMLGNGRGGRAEMERLPVVHVDYLQDLKMVSGDKMLDGLMLRDAGRSDALTASGGFCAPAQIVYDFVKINRPTDLAQDFLPVVGAPRGAMEYPDSPDIRDAFAGNLTRAYTNTDDINSVHKVTAVIACPSFNTCTVGAQYVILQFGNFGTRAYPEWVEHWIGLAMDVHAHKVSEKLIGQMIALSNASVAVGPNAGATGTLLGNFAMAAADYRQDLRTGRDTQLEIMFPSWTYDLVRSDLARARKGRPDDTLNVTDAEINAWIGSHGLTPRPVTDWQNIDGNSNVGTTVWPSGLSFLLFSPGTFVKLDMGTLDLGIVRDSVLNATNDYNIFVETFESVCKPGLESRLYSTSICANGAFSADQNLNCAAIDIPGS